MDKDKSSKEIIEDFIKKNQLESSNKDRLFKICFNEAWFSNTLAWLLDPKGSHNLGVNFANEFLKKIAKIRANGAKKKKYNTKGSLLAWRKKKQRRSALGFSLNNASVIREFYLAKSIRKRNGRGPKFCDIAFFDLDTSDSLSDEKTRHKEIFDFISKYQNELQILFTLSDSIRKAQEFEQMDS